MIKLNKDSVQYVQVFKEHISEKFVFKNNRFVYEYGLGEREIITQHNVNDYARYYIKYIKPKPLLIVKPCVKIQLIDKTLTKYFNTFEEAMNYTNNNFPNCKIIV